MSETTIWVSRSFRWSGTKENLVRLWLCSAMLDSRLTKYRVTDVQEIALNAPELNPTTIGAWSSPSVGQYTYSYTNFINANYWLTATDPQSIEQAIEQAVLEQYVYDLIKQFITGFRCFFVPDECDPLKTVLHILCSGNPFLVAAEFGSRGIPFLFEAFEPPRVYGFVNLNYLCDIYYMLKLTKPGDDFALLDYDVKYQLPTGSSVDPAFLG